MKLRVAPYSIALVFAAGSFAAHVLAARAPQDLRADFAQPLVVVTGWHAYGGAAFAVLAATVGLAAIATFLVTRSAPVPSHPGRDVAFAAAAAVAAAWTWPFVFSSDVYAYAAYGAMAASGLDPYSALPPSAHGAFVGAARWQWSGTYPVCVYGPVFVALARSTFAAFGSYGVGATLWALRGLAALAFVASIAALDVVVASCPPRRRLLALCAFGLNPVAIWSVAEGHNDALVVLAIFLGAALIRRGRLSSGALLAGLSASLKATGVPLALGLALDALILSPFERGRRIALATLAGLALATWIALPPLLRALAVVRGGGRYAPTASLQSVFGIFPVLAVALVVLVYAGARLRGGKREGWAWLGIAVWLALPNAYPWYALWLLPAAVAAGEGFAAAALWGATISSVLRYLPDAVGDLGRAGDAWTALMMAAPLLVATLAIRLTPIQKKATSA